MPTYYDYLWLRQYFYTSFALGYCAAVITNCTPAQVLRALGTTSSHSEAMGIAELMQVENEVSGQSDVSEPKFVVAVAGLDEQNTLLIQLHGGTFAVVTTLMRPLFPEHEVVSHYLSANDESQFIWWSNGERKADFELVGVGPMIGDERVVDLISQVSRIGGDNDSHDCHGERAAQVAFALAERITGVSIPAALFEAGRFTVAVVTGTPTRRAYNQTSLPYWRTDRFA